jgi:hypothetical protein
LKYPNSNKSNFKGKTAFNESNDSGMNHHVFQCHDEASNSQQFEKTLDALLEYINKELEFFGNIATLCEDYTVLNLQTVEPKNSELGSMNMFMNQIWDQEVDRYLERVKK